MASILNGFLRFTSRSVRQGAIVAFALTAPWAACAENLPQVSDAAAAEGDPCSPAIRQLVAKLTTDDSVFSGSGKSCLITGLKVSKSPLLTWEIADLRVEQADGASSLDRGMRAAASGIVFSPDAFDARARYLARNQQSPYEVSLDYLVDPPLRQFKLNELSVGNTSIGYVRLKFEAMMPADSRSLKAPAPMEAQATVDSLFDQWPTFQFTSVSLELDNKGVFEKILLPLWINALPDGEDPETLVPRDLASATEQVMLAPATVITPASRAALTRFLRDLPHPSGKLGLRLRFAEPQQISGLTAIVSRPDEFWQRAEAVEADYVPASTIEELPPETLP